jgi:phosphonate transport system permease protein
MPQTPPHPHPVSAQRWLEARRRRWRALGALLLLLTLLTWWTVSSSLLPGTDWQRMGGLHVILVTVGRFLPPDLSLIPSLLQPALDTVLIAIIGTVLGSLISLPVALLGARNLAPLGRFGYLLARALMTLSRSVHEIIWALIFVSAVGLGAFAGILALACRSVGFISKILSEAIERIDPRPIEAIQAVGGSRWQVVLHGVFPQILPITVSTIIFEWDVNMNRAAVLGLVGAGGLGLAFYNQIIASHYNGVTTVLLAILAIILIGELVSAFLRRRMV